MTILIWGFGYGFLLDPRDNLIILSCYASGLWNTVCDYIIVASNYLQLFSNRQIPKLFSWRYLYNYLVRIYSHDGIVPIILLDCNMWELIVSHEDIKGTSLKCSNNQVQILQLTRLILGFGYGFPLELRDNLIMLCLSYASCR